MSHSISAYLANLREVGPTCQIKITPSEATIKILKQEKKKIPSAKVLAIIDTGASSTAVSREVVKKLELVSRGTAKVYTSARKSEIRNEYDISLEFGKDVQLHVLRALEANLGDHKIHCIIGRDVLELGVFTYDGPKKRFSLRFT